MVCQLVCFKRSPLFRSGSDKAVRSRICLFVSKAGLTAFLHRNDEVLLQTPVEDLFAPISLRGLHHGRQPIDRPCGESLSVLETLSLTHKGNAPDPVLAE